MEIESFADPEGALHTIETSMPPESQNFIEAARVALLFFGFSVTPTVEGGLLVTIDLGNDLALHEDLLATQLIGNWIHTRGLDPQPLIDHIRATLREPTPELVIQFTIPGAAANTVVEAARSLITLISVIRQYAPAEEHASAQAYIQTHIGEDTMQSILAEIQEERNLLLEQDLEILDIIIERLPSQLAAMTTEMRANALMSLSVFGAFVCPTEDGLLFVIDFHYDRRNGLPATHTLERLLLELDLPDAIDIARDAGYFQTEGYRSFYYVDIGLQPARYKAILHQ